MRVIHLISGGDVGGAKTHILSLLDGLRRHTEVTLVSFREGPFSDEARELGIDTKVITARGLRAGLGELTDIVREGKYDIVHCHGSRGNLMGALLKRKYKAPLVTTMHSDYRLDYLGRPLGHLTYGMANRVALRSIDYFIGVSDPISELLIQRGFPPDRMFTIYNGLDFTLPPRDIDKTEFLRSCGLDIQDGDVVAGIAARLSPVKDISTLLRAMSIARERARNLRLIISGDGEIADQLKKQCSELGLDGCVCFAGWMSDMDAFYRCIDINLLTSLSETFPFVLTEGARMSRPTISSRVGGTPVLIDHGVNGLLFTPGDADELAGHLVTLAENGDLRAELGRRLNLKASTHFSLDLMIARQLDIYNTIMRRSEIKRRGRGGVTICGAYGRRNAGDEAILEAMIDEIRGIDPDISIRVMSRDPRWTRKTYRLRSIFTFNPFSLISSLRRSKVFISGGGSLIQDVTSRRSLWFYLYSITLARMCGCAVMMYGCGIGPVTRAFNRKLARRVIDRNVTAITLREDSSLEELRILGVTRPEMRLAADPTLALSPADSDAVDSALVSEGIPPDGNYICFALRRWPGFDRKCAEFGRAAVYAYEKYGLVPVFLPIEQQHDLEPGKAAASYTDCPHYIIKRPNQPRVVMGLMTRMSVVVSMRLHALVFAARCGTPLIGAVYDCKVSAFLRYIGQHLYEEFADITFESLCDLIDQAVLQLGDGEARREAVRKLAEIESVNVEVLSRLLDGQFTS